MDSTGLNRKVSEELESLRLPSHIHGFFSFWHWQSNLESGTFRLGDEPKSPAIILPEGTLNYTGGGID
jgi:hypothetical protein